MSKKVFITICIAAFMSLGFVKQDENTLTQQHQSENYAIRYPDKWEINASGYMGTKFIILSPVEENDVFRENINLIIQDLSTYDINLDDFAQLSENQIKTQFGENSIIEHKKEGNHYKIIYQGAQNGIDMMFEQYYFLKDKKAYILTFTSIPTAFDAYKQIAEEILSSFTIK